MVHIGGVVVPVQRGKQQAVLAALLLNVGQVVSLDELAETLWGPEPPPSARVTIQDAAGHARSALALWRGDPLADVDSELLASREVPRGWPRCGCRHWKPASTPTCTWAARPT